MLIIICTAGKLKTENEKQFQNAGACILPILGEDCRVLSSKIHQHKKFHVRKDGDITVRFLVILFVFWSWEWIHTPTVRCKVSYHIHSQFSVFSVSVLKKKIRQHVRQVFHAYPQTMGVGPQPISGLWSSQVVTQFGTISSSQSGKSLKALFVQQNVPI